MDSAFVLAYLLAFIASFLGSIPFGIVNLTVLETTIRKDLRAGIIMALGAGLVEMLHGFLAVYCSNYISRNLEDNIYVKSFVLGLLILLAIYFLTKRYKAGEEAEKKRLHIPEVLRGAFFSLINPQALPYYVFVIAYLSSHDLVDIMLDLALPFILGVASGRFICLVAYAWLSVRIKSRMKSIGNGMNLAMGILFLALAIVQMINLI